jgi:hypothetical protein
MWAVALTRMYIHTRIAALLLLLLVVVVMQGWWLDVA